MRLYPSSLPRFFALWLLTWVTACAGQASPTALPSPSAPSGYPGGSLIVRNQDWTPVVQVFDGVEMVLAPAGCFNMGISPGDTGDSDELPLSTQCFNTPFWIDRAEVTNDQFVRLSGIAKLPATWNDADRPRENIRWEEAREFCLKRGGRLPTEAEWEYAARGPNALIYPWGNDWQPDRLVHPGNANAQTAPVGSKPDGVSWLGGLDMAGNVWEWTSTLFDGFVYPYTPDDGRENPDDLTAQRVIRGGSWYDASDFYARASNRGRLGATIQDFNIGFRCVRGYEQ